MHSTGDNSQMGQSERRERYVLRQWIAMRDGGFSAVTGRAVRMWSLWLACCALGIVSDPPHRSYWIGGTIGFFISQAMALRASHAFWPVMQRFIDWPKVEARVVEITLSR